MQMTKKMVTKLEGSSIESKQKKKIEKKWRELQNLWDTQEPYQLSPRGKKGTKLMKTKINGKTYIKSPEVHPNKYSQSALIPPNKF